ncbi:MAG: hypothetical protein KF708_02430 [Pirellulales bacterium]|nr:hypothetical protein [Pirellulales bacterium]
MMTSTAAEPRRVTLPLDTAVLVGGAVVLVAVIALTRLWAYDVGDLLTRNTVRLSLAWYAVALCLMMRLRDTDDWRAVSTRGRLTRWCWTWAIVVFLVHLAMAFHYYHGWSHAHAFERTREVSGVGEGIYISYFFTWCWIIDALWWWCLPARYAARSAWIDRLLHTFMLFIVFNGMVVFETGGIRWAGLVMFVLLAAVWTASHRPRAAIAT